jgi:hypothetical protein
MKIGQKSHLDINLHAVMEYLATILNRTMIGYAFIQPVLLFEERKFKAKRVDKFHTDICKKLAFVYIPAVR